MKIAIEHIETTIKNGERELVEAQNAVKATQRQLGEQLDRVQKLSTRNAELRAVVDALKAKPEPAEEKSVNGSNGKLRAKPDAASLKISQR